MRGGVAVNDYPTGGLTHHHASAHYQRGIGLVTVIHRSAAQFEGGPDKAAIVSRQRLPNLFTGKARQRQA